MKDKLGLIQNGGTQSARRELNQEVNQADVKQLKGKRTLITRAALEAAIAEAVRGSGLECEGLIGIFTLPSAITRTEKPPSGVRLPGGFATCLTVWAALGFLMFRDVRSRKELVSRPAASRRPWWQCFRLAPSQWILSAFHSDRFQQVRRRLRRQASQPPPRRRQKLVLTG
jgi:hypothetical protein